MSFYEWFFCPAPLKIELDPYVGVRIYRRQQRIRSLLLVLLFVLACGVLPSFGVAQTNEWRWVGGPQAPGPGFYGTLGVPSAENLPGNRRASVTWTDSKGNFWLFGGDGFGADSQEGYLNDLWEYNPSTHEWTWVGGSATASGTSGQYGTLREPAAGNIPPGRSNAVKWVDSKGNLWLFGGFSFTNDLADFNDLWKYDISTGQWTWISGSNKGNQPGVYGTLGIPSPDNTPGPRLNAVSWTDGEGNFWLFGGDGWGSNDVYGELNDLWMFNPATYQWTWIGGSNTANNPPSAQYGEKGTPSASNTPGGRFRATAWTDNNGNLWLFGGLGYDSTGNFGLLNDLWQYNPTTKQWAWISGNNTIPSNCFGDSCGIAGVYGTIQVPDSISAPGAREDPISWTDKAGDLWLFGGNGIDTAGTWGYLNDLWKFDPATKQWEWVNGNTTVVCGSIYCGRAGVYGTLNTPALGNSPGGRSNGASWTDTNGNLWLFGGEGIDITEVWCYLQDMWEFQPNSNGGPVTATPIFSPEPGTYLPMQTVSIDDSTPGATIYYSVDGAVPAIMYSGPLTVSSSETITAIASAAGYANSDLASGKFVIQGETAATPAFQPRTGTYSTEQTVTISDTTSGSTIYYTLDGSLPTLNSAVYTGPITVSSSETINAIAVADGFFDSAVSSAVYTIETGSTLSGWTWMGGSNLENQPGSYGTRGTPAANNIPAGRSAASKWTDKYGNFWLFGGSYPGSLVGGFNDLWEFNPSTGQWTWVSGSNSGTCTTLTSCGQPGVYGTLGAPAPTNTPGGRWGAAAWEDSSGHLWLFGGHGKDINGNVGDLNDLWEFDPSTAQWTWTAGSSTINQDAVYGSLGIPAPGNIPGSRDSAATWTDDNGNFWMFGGYGVQVRGIYVTLNDLWEFSPNTKEWTWMGGSDLISPVSGYQKGVYGTRGVAASTNIPGSRQGAATWVDHQGKLWLFGGKTSGYGILNDLWQYDPSLNRWTWMAGSNSPYCPIDPLVGGYNACTTQPGVYGSLGVPAPENTPGGGSGFASWTDENDNLWLLGGQSSDITRENDGFYVGDINALWVYNPSIGEWAWMGGNFASSNCSFVILTPIPFVVCDDSLGNYGTLQVSSSTNLPGSRISPAYWTDKDGNFWMFSGGITDLANLDGVLNDLWEYKPATTRLPIATTPIFSLKTGTYAQGGPLALSNGMPNASIYYTLDGSIPSASSQLYTGPINLSSSQIFKAIAIAPGYQDSAVALTSYYFLPEPAAPTFSPPTGTYNTVQSVSISDATSDADIAYTTDGTPVDSSSTAAIYTQPITVSTSEAIDAIAINPDPGFFVLDGLAATSGYVASKDATAVYTLHLPLAATPSFDIPSGTYNSTQTVTISDATAGATIYYTTDGTDPTTKSHMYAGPITIYQTETMKALAIASGYANSLVAVAQYTLYDPPQSFTIAASPSSLTIAPGQSGSASVSVTPQNGFSSAVNFTCSGLPAEASCSFSPATLIPSGAEATTQLTITVAAQSAARQGDFSPFPATVLIASFFLFGLRKRRRLIFPVLLAIAFVGITLLSGCGGGADSGDSGGNKGPGTQPSISIVTVTAASEAISQTTTISLTTN